MSEINLMIAGLLIWCVFLTVWMIVDDICTNKKIDELEEKYRVLDTFNDSLCKRLNLYARYFKSSDVWVFDKIERCKKCNKEL